ncbi:MAG: FAD-dependent oxidoreductase [Coriobacteriales bacterium]|jgi:succinate dehydrogenase/fumarate reductase flavoprotein subunit|nr:FAD-dependent oxidoreductase [Coriobacteriales bacterium]
MLQEERLSRRGFVQGALTGGAALLATGALVACSNNSPSENTNTGDERVWDRTFDVVVVGTGFAGLASAVTAADKGSSVLVVEKAPETEAGGNSRVCAQAVWTPRDVPVAVKYFKEITQQEHLGDLSDAVIEAFITYSSNNREWLTDVIDIPVKTLSTAEYPAAPSANEVKNEGTTVHEDGLGSQRIWLAIMEAAVAKGVEFAYETPMTDLVFNGVDEVIGIKAKASGSEISIAAKKAVILCCGGFEFNEEMKANYLQFPSLAWGTPHNTGDGHKICMAYDIDFWHMNSATPGTRIGIDMAEIDPARKNQSLDFEFSRGSGYLWLDKYGKRFMNEARPYQHGYGRNAVFYNDSLKMEWPRLPFWQVFDTEETARLTAGGSGWLTNIDKIVVSEGFERELAAGVIVKAETAAELAAQMGSDAAVVEGSINAFNEAATSGSDTAFGRPADNMRPLTPPYFAARVYPVMVNTNGGPRRDEKARILRTNGEPVKRLYSSGEFGSVWAWYYQGAGNVTECLAFGRIAGEQAAALEAWA